jgi:predicted O-methyltransferase YrrM
MLVSKNSSLIIIRKYVFLKSSPNNIVVTEMNFFLACNYLKYIIVSRHRKGHGIHSPFVFDLVSRVFRNKTRGDIVNRIEIVRKRLAGDKRLIDVLDLGAGSGKMKSDSRKVADIAKFSPVSEKYGMLLSNLAEEFGKGGIIEFGTSFGISTMYMAALAPEEIIYSMEGCQTIAEIAKENFKSAGFGNIKQMVGSFEELIPGIVNEKLKPGLIFIDGNHRKKAVLDYFEKMIKIIDSETVIVLDDIYISKEMNEAWHEIQHNENVSVTIDVFRMGIVFFRKGITRQNYIIRH